MMKGIVLQSVFPVTLLFFACGVSSALQIEHNVPPGLQQASDQGPVNPDEEINVTVHLKMPDKAAFNAAVEQLYNPASPRYQKWMTDEELARYAPGAAQVALVRGELEKHGLSVISSDPLGFSLRVHGTVASVESAFQTHIHQFVLNNKTFQANIEDAKLTGTAGDLVDGVSGLIRREVHSLIKRAINPNTGKAVPAIPLSKVNASGGLGSILTDDCFTSPKTFVFTTPGSALPVGVYFGNNYDDTTKVCGYTPSQLQAHYGLPAAYKAGFAGKGQTIALVEAYGYPTILDDANAFAVLTGLPLLDSSNFEIVYPEGPPKNPNLGALTGWDGEIALDVQWAHSIAPQAKIMVMVTVGQDNEDFQYVLDYVRTHHLANSVSNSWEEDLDLIAGPAELASYDAVLSKAAAQGISVNFASGDSGDNGLGSPIGAPEVPSDSPYATAVGGTSILNNPNGTGQEELGWGNDITVPAYNGVFDPPAVFGFVGGAGGGESVWYRKPSWQSALPGTGRQVPDVSALADPYTGVALVLTIDGTQYVLAGVGGTSLSCPIFSAFWALANESAGHPLGQAARRIAGLSSSEVIDVVPHTSPTDVAGTVFDSSGATYYSPADLFAGALYSTTEFVSAMWVSPAIFPPDSSNLLSFGTDSSLTVRKGWDNVTGFGVPNGLPFITGAGK